MQTKSRSDRWQTRGWLAIIAPLSLGLVIAAVLAYQAFDASREHRIAAHRTVQDHADFAAFLLSALVNQRLTLAMQYAFYQEDLANDGTPGRAAQPAVLRDADELARCKATIPASERYFFRLDLDRRDLIVDGPMPAAIRSQLVPRLVDRVGSSGQSIGGHVLFEEDDGGVLVISYRVRPLDHLNRTFVYGLNSCFRDRQGAVFETAGKTRGVLPPTLVGDVPNDSLFTLTVVGAEGERIFGPAVDEDAAFVGTSDLGPSGMYDGARLMVTLLPSVAERLVIGGLPPSRLPIALGLVSLTALLMTLAVLQLRRRQELIALHERFVGNVSHELRTPLQQILLYVDLLRLGRVRSESDRQQAVRVIHRESQRLIALVKNVLHLSRSSNDDLPLRRQRIDLAAVADATIASFRPLAEAEGTTIAVTCAEECLVTADPDAVRQVLLNLLDNATKYGPEGQRVSVTVFEETGHGCISVTDEGPGVPLAERENIWESFHRLDREESQAIAGSGIGLSIVRDLARSMGGDADVTNAENGGARFTVRFVSAS